MAKLKKLKVQETIKDPGEFSPEDPRNRMIHTGTGPVQNAPKELSINPHKTKGTPLDPSIWQQPGQAAFEQALSIRKK